MKIAVPVTQGLLCSHFGHCETFLLFDVDPAAKSILGEKSLTPPPHEPGVLPRWLAQQQATHILAGGMGERAIEMLRERGVEVVLGVPEGNPRELVQLFIEGRLLGGTNACDH